MTEPTWKYWIPERDGHAPDDWVEGMEAEYRRGLGMWEEANPCWIESIEYRYRPLQDETYEPDLLAQCLALPQDKREALIEAMQKPQRDWADDVAEQILCNVGVAFHDAFIETAETLRAMCRPKEVELSDAFLAEGISRLMNADTVREQAVLADIIREALS